MAKKKRKKKQGYQTACQRLLDVTPNDPDPTLALAGAYMRNLRPDDIEPASPRDSEEDVTQARREIEARFGWLCIGPEGERIQAVVNSADGTSEWDVLLAWEEHLRRSLRFPFEAEVDEFQERGPLQAGDRLTVLGIKDVDELYGIIVSCRKGRRRFDFPLADLAAVDDDSPNAQPIQDYRVWFANR